VAALALGLLAGTGEEILFRGAIQPRYGLLLTTLLYTVLHVQYELSLVSLGVFGLAILLGLERRWFGTTACILTHALYDALAILLQGTLR
jgi:membrane protease YdiL (CAAX protease family)